ncbi:MAG TPA: hypothetical protein VLL97_00720, partial [Acidobacteriota bacterium]|nr:hypothetical protein [Acidobacteriota bacterium]
MKEIADVAVPVGVRKTFTYSVPAHFRDRIAAGMRVVVPFGNKLLTGYVTGFVESGETAAFRLKAVRELIDQAPAIAPELVETAMWVARYYFAPPGEVFRTLFPAGSHISGERRLSLTAKAANLLEGGLRPPGLRPQEEAILHILHKQRSMTANEIAQKTGVNAVESLIESLSGKALILIETRMQAPKVKSKEQLGIRLLSHEAVENAGRTAAQRRLLAALSSRTMPFVLQEALDKAECGRSTAMLL